MARRTSDILALPLLAALFPLFAGAAEIIPSTTIVSGQGTVLDFESNVTRVYTSNPEVADPTVVSDREVLVNGKRPGVATLIVWLESGVRELSALSVVSDFEPIRELLKEAFPGEQIELAGSQESLLLKGRVATQETADRAIALLKPYAKSVVSNLDIVSARGQRQIGLHVLFAELDRSVSTSFGANLISSGAANTKGQITTGQFSPATPDSVAGGTNVFNLANALNIFAFRPDLNLGATVQALENKGLLQILAEPDLVTTDGKEARFTVGGEFPVPVPQAGSTPGAITIQFHEFGIRLSFLPVVTPNGTIRMHVAPEVSSLDITNAVTLAGFKIPALSTRRMETDIELREGQSFVIAGLLDNRVTENLSRVPGLASVPFFGNLFKSHERVKSRTELVIIVTPATRFPLPDGAAPPVPAMPERFLNPPAGQYKEQR